MGSRRHWYGLYNLSDIIRYRFEKGLHFGEDRISYAYLSKMENPHFLQTGINILT